MSKGKPKCNQRNRVREIEAGRIKCHRHGEMVEVTAGVCAKKDCPVWPGKPMPPMSA